jgi:hypothetical protein
MYYLIEYYEENDKVKQHPVDYTETLEVINKKKLEIAKELNDIGIDTLEIIATKNIQGLKKILKTYSTKIFQVVEK